MDMVGGHFGLLNVTIIPYHNLAPASVTYACGWCRNQSVSHDVQYRCSVTPDVTLATGYGGAGVCFFNLEKAQGYLLEPCPSQLPMYLPTCGHDF